MNQETTERLLILAKDALRNEPHQTQDSTGRWHDCPAENFIDNLERYGLRRLRIKPDPSQEVARGHNPHGVTVAQIGDGFRLFDTDEVKIRENDHPEIESWEKFKGEWKSNVNGCALGNTYRTRLSREALAALDKPEPEYWSRPEHVPGPVCWIERSMNGWPCLVTEVQDNGIVIGSKPGFLLTWEHMKDCLWSPTRAKGSFLPCTTPSK